MEEVKDEQWENLMHPKDSIELILLDKISLIMSPITKSSTLWSHLAYFLFRRTCKIGTSPGKGHPACDCGTTAAASSS